MSQYALDLRRSLQIMRRRRAILGIAAALGLLIGVAYSVITPPMATSQALVVLPDSVPSTATQVVFVTSDEVLSGALPAIRPAVSIATLREDIRVKGLTSYILSISASSGTAAKADAMANAVAASYIAKVTSVGSPVGRFPARMLQRATSATTSSLGVHALVDGIAGGVCGLLVGGVVALAIGRKDRRLRDRDAIARSIGVPVLASIPVRHPDDPAGWVKLLEDYEPRPVHALRLYKALQSVGIAGGDAYGGMGNNEYSLAVLSLSSDPKAFALGPQLAVFAASLGIQTTLVVGTQQDIAVTAALRTACGAQAATLSRSGRLRAAVSTDADAYGSPGTALTVVVAVVDDRNPRLADITRTNVTMLGVSAGAMTADQLARAAMSAAADGREVSGILVADPEPGDRTTGRIPLARPVRIARPTRLNGATSEIRR